jgi:hypothetical protein
MLGEAILGVGALAFFLIVCYSSLVFSRLGATKTREQGIICDFVVHYVETLKALPFSSIGAGTPISPLFDGSGGSPTITIPASGSATALNTPAYLTFHPDLLWVTNSNPQLCVTYTTNFVKAAAHDIHVAAQATWDPPVGRGTRLGVQFDLVRTKDL